MPKGTPRRSGGFFVCDLYAFDRNPRFEAAPEHEAVRYWFSTIGRVPADGFARYNGARYRWHEKHDLPALLAELRKEDSEFRAPEELKPFIKLWEPEGSYRQPFWL